MNNSGSWNMDKIKETLRVQVKNQVIFSSILTVGGKRETRNRFIMHTSSWLCGWCQHEGLVFMIIGLLMKVQPVEEGWDPPV